MLIVFGIGLEKRDKRHCEVTILESPATYALVLDSSYL
jgi:hypothetical protein